MLMSNEHDQIARILGICMFYFMVQDFSYRLFASLIPALSGFPIKICYHNFHVAIRRAYSLIVVINAGIKFPFLNQFMLNCDCFNSYLKDNELL